MRIAITGSIATDHLMTFDGRFAELLIDGHLTNISLSFLASHLTVHRGGVGANIALGLARLGHSPTLVGAAGVDFAEYGAELAAEGVKCWAVRRSATEYTARFLCTTDLDHNQIATFYPGAMSEAKEISLGALAAQAGSFDLVLIGADDPGAMLRHTDECRAHGMPFAADPSQQLARMDGEAIRRLVQDAAYLFTNAYEHVLLCEKTGWSNAEVLERVGHWITTLGRDGAQIERAGRPPVEVPAIAAVDAVDPTGVGDGFRAGMLAGLSWDLPLERAAQLGCAVAKQVLSVTGPQGYRIEVPVLLAELAQAYGADAADDLRPHLPQPVPAASSVGGRA